MKLRQIFYTQIELRTFHTVWTPERKRPLKDQELNSPLETLRRSRSRDSLRNVRSPRGSGVAHAKIQHSVEQMQAIIEKGHMERL